jgi:hypothetical protein
VLREPDSGGLVPEDENSPAYTGTSYIFAEGQPIGEPPNQFSVIGTPIQVKLRTRCANCHNDLLTQVNTFAIAQPPHPPAVRQLNPAADETAHFDIVQKLKERDFVGLRAYFDSAASAATRH